MAPSKRWVGIVGVLAVVAPRLVLSLHAKVNLLGFRNAEDVEPSSWLVRVTQVAGLGAVLFAVLGPKDAVKTRPTEETDGGIDFV